MSTPAVREGTDIVERPATGPGRELGQKRKAQLRLALGYRDTARRGAPVKTEYFIPHGEDPIVEKFQSVYGDEPKAIDIRLPSSLGAFLDIRHVAFAGGQNDGGGILKAIGSVNFALEGTLGGPDRLTVFNIVDTGKKDRNKNPVKELQAEEILIDDVDDPSASELGVYLQATVTFGIPDVLGFGGICEVRSRGKETIDTLWQTAVDIYGQLGPQASMILRPKLILKPSTMMTPVGSKASLYVVDLYVPESLDEVFERLREMRQLMPGGPAAALYDAEQRPAFGVLASGPVATVPAEGAEIVHRDFEPTEATHDPSTDEDVVDASQQAGTETDFVPAPGDTDAEERAAETAASFVVALADKTNWAHGLTFAQIAEQPGDRPELFFGYMLRLNDPPELVEAAYAYTRVRFPALYADAIAGQS